ncbi:MAG: tetratricopeptide repeat protein, partial [Anaerolineae bacterium]|nr:tetratricopeptide repeat protein [Anaerolineae bacterium]
LLVCAYRSDEAPYLYGKLPLAKQIELAPLNREEIQDIVRKVLGERADLNEIVDFLHLHTEGNALFLVEVLRIMAENAGGIEQIRAEQFPVHLASMGVIRVLKQRLRHVPLDDHPLLRLAALLGQEINFSVLRAYDDEMDYEGWLLRAADAAILTVQDGIWRFTHDKVREAMLVGLDDSYLRKLHGMAAQAMEKLYGDKPAYIKAIAEHWRSAGRFDREVLYMPALAERLNNQGLHQEALVLIERGLESANKQKAEFSQIIANLRVSAAHSHINQGQFELAQEHLDVALQLVQAENEPNLYAQALAALGKLSEARGDFVTAASQLDQAIEIFRAGSLETSLLAALTNRAIVAAKTGNLADASALFEEILAKRMASGDVAGQAGVLINIGNIALIRQDQAKAQEYFERGLAIAEAEGLYSVAAGVLNNLGEFAIEQGNYAGAMAYLQRAKQVAELTDSHERIILNEYYLGMVTCFREDFAAAQEHFEVAYRIAQETNSRYELLQTACTYTHIAFARGDRELGRRLFTEVLSLVTEMNEPFLLNLPLYSAVAVALDMGAYDLAAEWMAFLLSRFQSNEVRYRHLSLYVQPRLQEQIGETAWKLAQIRSKSLDLPSLVQHLYAQFVSQP